MILPMSILSPCSSVLSQEKCEIEDISPGEKIGTVQKVKDERAVENAQGFITPRVRTAVISKEDVIRNPTGWCVVTQAALGAGLRVVIENETYPAVIAKKFYERFG
jgi:hypothetical protein